MPTDEYTQLIETYRKNREDIVNNIREKQHLNPIDFEYFPISEEWRVSCTIIMRKKAKEGFTDYQDEYERIGKVKFQIKGTEQPSVQLYRLKNTEKLFIFVRDLTSGQTTYSSGRIVPIFQAKEASDGLIDFNLASNPLCAYIAGAACPLASDSIFYSIEAGEKAPKEKFSYE